MPLKNQTKQNEYKGKMYTNLFRATIFTFILYIYIFIHFLWLTALC